MTAGQRIRHPAASATAAAFALLLSGCSGNPLGDQLARSFSAPSPQQTPATQPKPADAGKAANDASTSTTTAKAPAPTDTTGTAIAPRTTPPPVASSPAPYRITIKLPAADPSALYQAAFWYDSAGERGRACLLARRLRDRFPGSEEAALSRDICE